MKSFGQFVGEMARFGGSIAEILGGLFFVLSVDSSGILFSLAQAWKMVSRFRYLGFNHGELLESFLGEAGAAFENVVPADMTTGELYSQQEGNKRKFNLYQNQLAFIA